MTTRNLRRQLRTFSNRTEQPLKLYSGALGVFIGGTQYVDVPNRPGFVYVRLRNNISELIQAHNSLVSPVYDLPVLVVRNQNYYEIYSRDSQQYGSYWDTTSSFMPRHGFQHEFDPDNNGGGDLVFVHGEQFYPLMGFPSGTSGAGNILIAPYRYYANSSWHYAGNTGTPNLTQYRPTGSANAKLVLVGLTIDTGNPFVKLGTEFSATITGAMEMTQYVPTDIDTHEEIPGTIVRLVTGTSVITWANIYDARQYMGIIQDNSFLGLSDTPNAYTGSANKIVVVKPDESGLEFILTATGSSSAGGDGIQETWYPTSLVSTYTGSNNHNPPGSLYVPYSGTYYQFTFVPGSGGSIASLPLAEGSNKPALMWVTNTDYDVKQWLLRGEYTALLSLARQTGSHPMTAFCQLIYQYNGQTEQLMATSDLGEDYSHSTAIVDTNDGPLFYAFRMRLDETSITEDGPIQQLANSSERFIIKLFVNASSGGSDGHIRFYPSANNFLNLNLQRQVLDNHYFPLSGTFTQLSDTPDSYSGQGSKFVAVKSTADGLEFVNSPGGGGGSSVLAQDEGILLGTGTVFNFVGGGVDASISGSVVRVHVTGSNSRYDLLQEVYASGTKSVTFQNISSNYRELAVSMIARTNFAGVTDSVKLFFNSDFLDTNYRQLGTNSDGSTVFASSANNAVFISVLGVSGSSNQSSYATISINGYKETVFDKQFLYQNRRRNPGNTFSVNHGAGWWENTSAINRIDFQASGTFQNGSIFRLYGIG